MALKSRSVAKVTVLSEHERLSLVEICTVCRISADDLIEAIEEGILEPEGKGPAEWRFRASDLPRLQKALRLQRELRVNLPGAALALQLIDELEAQRRRFLRESSLLP
jgi:chaperone modulatory protein CbpM